MAAVTGIGELVVLVGRRNGAVRAAKRLGLNSHIVAPGAIDDGVTRFARRAAAVVATTEAAVMPAARLRSSLGLSGTSIAVARLCTDKLAMKRALSGAGIRCARFEPVPAGPVAREKLLDKLGLPLVLKTQTGSGGRGTRFVRDAGQLPEAVTQPCIAESFVEGVEMSVESLVVDGVPVFVNFTEYAEPAWANLVPAALAPELTAAIRDMNALVISSLGIERGMTHMEIFLTAGTPVFGEIAARPPGGLIMSLIELAYGFDPWQALVAIETGRVPEIRDIAGQAAAMRFFHPGVGVVRSIRGLDELKNLDTAHAVVCKLAPGDRIGPRTGTGQHCGYALLAGEADQVRRDLESVRQSLRIELRPS